MAKHKPKIFISYRRDDSIGYVGRLHDALVKHLDASHIFRDIDTVKAGEDLYDVTERSMRSCDILIAIIGNQWVTISNGGVRRLDEPGDFVRLEIATALSRNIPVVPVLVQGATIPRVQELPDDLRPLVRRKAFELSDTRWDYDVKQLIKELGDLSGQTLPRRNLRLAIGCVICAVSISIGIASLPPPVKEQGHQPQPTEISVPSPAPPPESPSPTHTYVWSRKSSLYHFASCKYVRQINRANLEEGDVPPPDKTLHAGCPRYR